MPISQTNHSDQLTLHYQVAMPQPSSHLFEVTLTVENWQSPLLDLKFPVWTPGSYLVREYARHLQGFTVLEGFPWQKLSKNHWQVGCPESPAPAAVTICYQVFANELTVRTNHLDSTHGYFNGAALFFYLPGFEQTPITVTIVPPYPDWQVTTPLSEVSGVRCQVSGVDEDSRYQGSGVNNKTLEPDIYNLTPVTFYAPDFDTLVDSPVEIGKHSLCRFEVLGKPHEFAVYGTGNLEPERIIQDTSRIIEVEAELFGGLPYDRYLFLLHLSPQGNGGLEHKTSCSLNYPRFSFRAVDKYNRFMQLVAHEFFHLWNVKRIRPKALEVFDYDAENYTPSLWFSEGTTSYYDGLIPYRAGIYNAKALMQHFSREITRFLTTTGRLVQPLSESSFDAWIKLYRQDANSSNSQMSYYLKGEMVSLLLDLLIRRRHDNQRSLDDVLRQMWEQFGKPEIGFTPEALQAVIETVADRDLTDFFQRYLHGLEELPFNEYLAPFGLSLIAEATDDKPPHLGITVRAERDQVVIKGVEAGSPAERAGLSAGDELLAIDQFRVTADQLDERLRNYQPGAIVTLTTFHQDQLRTCATTLATAKPGRYDIVPIDHPTPSQEKLFFGWLGNSLDSLLD